MARSMGGCLCKDEWREGSLYVQMDGCVVDVWIGGGREVCIDAFAVG